MGYAETLLASGERVTRRAHQHWFMLIWNAKAAVLALLIAVFLFVVKVASAGTGLFFDLLGWATLVLVVLALLTIGWSYLRYQNEEYVITSRRLIHAEGVINKKASDSSLEKINDAVLSESIFGRIFGFGDLDVLTASEGGDERLRMLRDAKEFKKAMLESKHELEIEVSRPTMPAMRMQEQAPAAAHVAPNDSMTADEVSAAITRLGDMRDRALITPEEFEAKRKEMLARL
jgi:uncharacterized membrane protein YdbT with pleckstrin-like domain